MGVLESTPGITPIELQSLTNLCSKRNKSLVTACPANSDEAAFEDPFRFEVKRKNAGEHRYMLTTFVGGPKNVPIRYKKN